MTDYVERAAADGELSAAVEDLRAARLGSHLALLFAVDSLLDVADDIAERFPLMAIASCADDDCRTSGACQDRGRCWGPPS